MDLVAAVRLFIAEKPSVARAIAEELGVTAHERGALVCHDDVVTWCFGHMLEQAEPDEYTSPDAPRGANGKKRWREEDLPIIPDRWISRPRAEAREQLAVIGRWLKKATHIINAGDPDREGQLLIDELLEHFIVTRPVSRYWVNAVDSVSVRRGLAALSPNGAYSGFGAAARARARADWLIGMNLSRAYTLRAQRGGARTLLTVGRVQTPTLALVVMRDREIESFKPCAYQTLTAEVGHVNGGFLARWTPAAKQPGLDSEGRLVDPAIAAAIVARVKGQRGQISSYNEETKSQAPPLPMSLADITAKASATFGYSADEVLGACQALYETHKLTTYPRTDAQYLPESQHADAPAVLGAIGKHLPALAELAHRVDPARKSKAWDDTKVTAHHAIIPTMHQGDHAPLSEIEGRLYELIARTYLAQFLPSFEYLATTIEVAIQGERFRARGRRALAIGWRESLGEEDETPDESEDELAPAAQALPSVRPGDPVKCGNVRLKSQKTKPPPYYTDGTLLRAMQNIHKVVTDSELKRLLRDGDGIGTPATRAQIIKDLKRREFLESHGKKIRSSATGRALVDAIPQAVRDPSLTALYERVLKNIEQGNAKLEDFIAKQEAFIREEVSRVKLLSGPVSGIPGAEPSSLHKCMNCGKPLARRTVKGAKRRFWGCTGYPDCRQNYADINGKPNYESQKERVHGPT